MTRRRPIWTFTIAILLGLVSYAAAQIFTTPAGESMIDDTNDALRVNVVVGTIGAFGTVAALADNTTNPSTGQIASFLMGLDGTTWDRITATLSALDVNVKSITAGVGITVDTDDASIAGGQGGAGLMAGLRREFDGTNWLRPIEHDGVDNAGAPYKLGMRAIAHGTNPTAVAAADMTHLYANRAGIPFMIGGHPNVITTETAHTVAETNLALVTVATLNKIVVTQAQFLCDNAVTVDVGFRIGFATVTTPTTTGVVLSHPGIKSATGGGVSRGDGSGILGVGADDEDLRITSEVPTGGSCRSLVTHYTVPS